ncbi:GatB/YqeY domain-containing protein [Cellulomonas sp. SLBN-39]|uniref:GatB/YqeY domain-containing protein n=1 Tax=Cellulomonas sp. SLBN-39 TaxID=2768446 RepID=UPI00116A59C3|nr:uncharacterized protein YqeY [Cellulomonas sp. SLBN-39]
MLGHVLGCALVVGLVVVVPGTAASAIDATEGLRVEDGTTYRLDLAGSVVHVEHVATITHEMSAQYYFPDHWVPVMAGAVGVTATADDGTVLPVTMEPGDDVVRWAAVDLRPDLQAGQTRTVRVTYDLPAQEPRNPSFAQVNPAYATFPLFTAADPGLGSVRVEVPAGVDASVVGDGLERTVDDDGTQVWTADGIEDSTWWANVVAHDDAELAQELVFFNDIGVKVQAWPGDTAWLDLTTDLVERGLPVLRETIGRPWGTDGQLTVRETSTPYVYGYGGWYQHEESLIEVGDALDAHVVLHEMSHAWFNHELFDGRWINEALADELAAVTMTEIGMDRPVPDPVDPGSAAALPLNAWEDVDLGAPDAEETEEYGYGASFWLGHALVDEIGVETTGQVLAAAWDRDPTYPAATDESRHPHAIGWQGFLDLLEGVGGSTRATQLYRDLVVTDEQQALLDERAQAREAYAALVERGAGWAPPAALRDAMAAWEFDDAQALTPRVGKLLSAREALDADLAAIDLTAPAALRRTFETSTDLAALHRTLADVRDAARSVARADAARADAGPLAVVGLALHDVDGDAAAARTALAAGDWEGATRAADAADAGASGAARDGGLLVLLLVVLAAAASSVVVVRRRRRAVAPATGAGVEVGAAGAVVAEVGAADGTAVGNDAAPAAPAGDDGAMSQTLSTLTADLTTAMKARDELRRDTLRQVIAAVRTEAKAGDVERELGEDEVLQVLAREVKKRRDTAETYTQVGATDRAERETAEAEIISTYLPARLTEAELEALVRDAVAEVGATSMRDMGAVMKVATERAGTSADGRTLSALVRQALAG